MVTYKCDKCGEEESIDDELTLKHDIKAYRIDNALFDNVRGSIHLCPECKEKLKKFLIEKQYASS